MDVQGEFLAVGPANAQNSPSALFALEVTKRI
jgi:hypothetical protein